MCAHIGQLFGLLFVHIMETGNALKFSLTIFIAPIAGEKSDTIIPITI